MRFLLQNFALACAISICLLISVAPSWSETAQEAENKAAWAAAANAGTQGPAEIKLIDQAKINVPKSLFYIPQVEAARLLRAFGNTPPGGLVGMVLGTGAKDNWMVIIRYVKQGFIKDDDAKEWNADTLLEGLRTNTEIANKDRAARGFPELDIIGWSERPLYEPRTHRLAWAIMTKDKGFSDINSGSANYNTYALGREGYFGLNLVTTNLEMPEQKPIVSYLLGGLSYDIGKRYEDFNASTDHIAEYGLAALVGGLVVKKAGWLAIIAAFFLKFAKIAILGCIAAVYGVYKIALGLFRRNKPPD